MQSAGRDNHSIRSPPATVAAAVTDAVSVAAPDADHGRGRGHLSLTLPPDADAVWGCGRGSGRWIPAPAFGSAFRHSRSAHFPEGRFCSNWGGSRPSGK